ncbi:MAG TPA: rhomboid family intramembrane serine protease [Longimicrobium sp.]|nr:rhomboid family intramembrane serine protease [Longimicrobium sp.]
MNDTPPSSADDVASPADATASFADVDASSADASISFADASASPAGASISADAPASSADPAPARRENEYLLDWGRITDRKPAISEFGYWDGRRLNPSTREGLTARCGNPPLPERVWTPETGAMVEPWRVPWLFDEIYRPDRAAAGEQVKVQGMLFGIYGILAFAMALGGGGTGALVLAVVFGVSLYFAVQHRRELAEMTPEKLEAQLEEVKTQPPARVTGGEWTGVLAVAIGVVSVLQVVAPGSSIESAGLVKDAARGGEWWRMLTTAMLHGGVWHLLMNLSAAGSLGVTVERYSHRAYVPLVFLLATLAASTASLLLVPDRNSVGASGGLMGLMGFLVIIGWRRRGLMPKGFTKSMAVDVGLMVMIGIVGYRFIDNAAHAGGLLAGMILGLLWVPRGGEEAFWTPGALVRAAGTAAMAILLATAVFALFAMFIIPGS